jgi:hypothetical protein
MWEGDSEYRFAPALETLFQQLRKACPGTGWQNSPQTGSFGDASHMAEGDRSDHVPWLDNTVRALDVAANVSGVSGIVTVTDAPDCEALFAMVNRMYGARDPRVWPTGYAMFHHRITDWDRPGEFRATTADEDPHLYHLHISVSQDPAGFNSTAPWPLPGEGTDGGTAQPITIPEDGMFEIIHDTSEPLVGFYAWSLGCWRLISGNTQFQMAKASGLAANGGKVRAVTHAQRERIQNLALGH